MRHVELFENFEDKSDDDLKNDIDKMTHYELARMWRFGELGNKYLQGEVGEYFKRRLFDHFGGFTPELSKRLGWRK